jgi:Cu(I)/Ag(I) efflux system membrane fusion protein
MAGVALMSGRFTQHSILALGAGLAAAFRLGWFYFDRDDTAGPGPEGHALGAPHGRELSQERSGQIPMGLDLIPVYAGCARRRSIHRALSAAGCHRRTAANSHQHQDISRQFRPLYVGYDDA